MPSSNTLKTTFLSWFTGAATVALFATAAVTFSPLSLS
jgi:hypothetical protein